MTDIQTQIERAVAEERERCAKIADAEAEELETADSDCDDIAWWEAKATAEHIAAAIRKGDR